MIQRVIQAAADFTERFQRARVAARAGFDPGASATPHQGRWITPDVTLDGFVQFVTDGLTFSKLRGKVNAAIRGDLALALQLCDEMERKDPRIRSVAGTRRRALTGLDWEIVSAADVMEDLIDRKLADEAALFVRERFAKLRGLRAALKHASKAIGSNLSVCEMVWEGRSLIDLQPVWNNRVLSDPLQPGVVRVLTAEERSLGVVAKSPDFVVHTPEGCGLFPFESALSASQAIIFLSKALAFADWKVFCEIFGMPVRTGTFRQGASEEEKKELVDMLANLGTKAWGAFSESVKLELLESTQRGSSPFEAFLNFCNREIGVLWLGGNLTSDTTGGTGTFAAANVQDRVRDDLRDEDIAAEGEMVREQIIAPLCFYEFARPDVPLPIFRRKKPETVDRVNEAGLFAQCQKIGMRISREYAHSRLGIPEPEEADDVLEAPDAFEFALGEPEGKSGEGTRRRSDEGAEKESKGKNDSEGVEEEEDEEGGDLA